MRVSECPVLPSHEQSMVAVRAAQSRYIPQSLSSLHGSGNIDLNSVQAFPALEPRHWYSLVHCQRLVWLCQELGNGNFYLLTNEELRILLIDQWEGSILMQPARGTLSASITVNNV